MVLQRGFDPKSPHGSTTSSCLDCENPPDGFYVDDNGDLALLPGWGINVGDDGISIDQAELDSRYIDVEVSTTVPTLPGVKIWVNTAEEYPVLDLEAEVAELKAIVASLLAGKAA